MKKKFNTTSCPCSSYSVKNSNGTVGCERNNFGQLEYVSPVVLHNHLINNSEPIIGDKWSCGGSVKCGSPGFKWNTLHVVDVTEDTNQTNSSRVETTSSTSNCFIPKSSLRDYETGEELSEWDRIAPGINGGEHPFIDTSVVKEVSGMPIFNNREAAKIYAHLVGGYNDSDVSGYYDNGVLMFAPKKYYGDKGLITGVTVNGRNMFNIIVGSGFTHTPNAFTKGKVTMSSTGGTLKINILSEGLAGATIRLTDSSGCSVFKTKKNNQLLKSEYTIKEVIPALGLGKTQEVYDIEITPNADTQYWTSEYRGEGSALLTGVFKCKVWQFKNPELTFNSKSSTLAATTTTTTSVSIKGTSNTSPLSFKPITHTTTITPNDDPAKVYYRSKRKLLLDHFITDSSVIEKRMVNESKAVEYTSNIQVADRHARVDASKGDLEIGMRVSGEYEETKTLQKSIDLYPLKEPCDNCDVDLDILTNKFEFENVSNLIEGMGVEFVNSEGLEFTSSIKSIDCNVGITLHSHHVVDRGTVFTFKHTGAGGILKVDGNNIELDSLVYFPHNTRLFCTNINRSAIEGTVTMNKSGSPGVVITTVINGVKFGQSDVAFELDPDLFLSLVPNAYDQKIVVAKDQIVGVDFLYSDNDFNAKDKGVLIVSGPKMGRLASNNVRYTSYKPNKGFTGEDKIIFQSHVGEGGAAVYSEEKTVTIKVK